MLEEPTLTFASAPALSICVATRNRAAVLPRLLRSLEVAQATAGDVEILVVDNGSSDETAALLAQWVAAGDGRTRLFVDQPGKSRALNHALGTARAALLAFTDDDVEVAPEWVEAILGFFTAYPQYDAAMGRVLIPAAAQSDPELLARLAAYRTVPVFDKGEVVREVREMYGCNMAVRRRVFDRIGVFDERLGPGASGLSEDLDLARRMIAAGMRIGYMPRALVRHEVDPLRLTKTYYRDFQVRLGRSGLAMDVGRHRWRSVPRLLEAAFGVACWTVFRSPIRRTRAWGRMVRHADILRHRWERARTADRQQHRTT